MADPAPPMVPQAVRDLAAALHHNADSMMSGHIQVDPEQAREVIRWVNHAEQVIAMLPQRPTVLSRLIPSGSALTFLAIVIGVTALSTFLVSHHRLIATLTYVACPA